MLVETTLPCVTSERLTQCERRPCLTEYATRTKREHHMLASARHPCTDEFPTESEHDMPTTYRLEFTADEIVALYDAITAADRAQPDLASAADKLAWMSEFLAHPDEFASELRAMRVDDEQLLVSLDHAQRNVAEWHHRALRGPHRSPSAREYRFALAKLREIEQQLDRPLTDPDSRLLAL